MVTTGVISPRTERYVDRLVLANAVPYNVFGKYGTNRVLPKKSSQTIMFRRYENLPPATTPLTEGVRPGAGTINYTDYLLKLQQYGYWVNFSDVVMDTLDDPILNDTAPKLGQQAGETLDILRFNVLKAGTSVFYSNGAARDAVNTVIAIDDLHRIDRFFKEQNAKVITELILGGSNVNGVFVAPSYRAICHPNCLYDISQITGFQPASQYGQRKNVPENEFGSIGQFRFEWSTNADPWLDDGGAFGNMESESGAAANVYPILIFAKDAYVLVAFGGKNAVKTYITQPGGHGDELHQQGAIGWKTMTGTKITNDNFMARLEVAVTASANIT